MIHLTQNQLNKYKLLTIFKKYLSRQDINLKSKNSKLKLIVQLIILIRF